jgi:hypothetical protein
MKNIKLKTLTFALLLGATSYAQETSKTTFGGNADFYYRFNFANNVDGKTNNLTSFTNSHDSFQIGMASIKATHKEGKASVVADLGFGSRASEFTYNDAANTFMIKQLNMTYEFSNEFKVTAGSFATHLGYELVDATDNKNYSMSYAFTYGPFFNTGVKAQYTSGAFSLMAGVTNPTDFKTALAANSRQKTVIGQIGYTVDSGSVLLNFTTGSNNRSDISIGSTTLNDLNLTQFDLVATKKINDKVSIALNGTYGTQQNDAPNTDQQKWFSAVGYANIAISKKSSLAYRIEYFDDKDGIKLGVLDNSVIANTLSLNLKDGKFTFIPELRFDSAKQDIFVNGDGSSLTKSAASILFATTYSF